MSARYKLINKGFKLYDMILTSIHESAHVIYALLHGMHVESVQIFEHKKLKRINGYTVYVAFDTSKVEDPALINILLMAEIGVKYAGLTAEKYHFKITSGSNAFPAYLKDGSSSDTLEAAEIIKTFNLAPPGKKRFAYKNKMISKTYKKVQEYWDDITLLSHVLFKQKKLNFADIKNILIKKSKNKKFWKAHFKNIEVMHGNMDFIDEPALKILLSD